jgi:3-oxoacyl-[acyl-carrier-protein] synthase III
MAARVAATASYLPEHVVRNEDLTQFPAETLSLIAEKTGIRTRRHADDGQSISDLAAAAAEACLKRAGLRPAELGGVIVATSSPDRIQPATAARVQHLLGAAGAYAFDLNSVCSGAVFGVYVADALVRAGGGRPVLVVGAEIYSRFLNPGDFSTYPYFGDGAGAVLLADGGDGPAGVLASALHTDGSGADLIQVPAGGSMLPLGRSPNAAAGYFRMNGRAVYKFATTSGPAVIQEVLAQAGVSANDVRYFVCHQANVNILREIAERVGVGFDRFPVCLDRYGNTAGASVLIMLDELVSGGKTSPGDLVVLAGFGGGLSWGANLIRL